MTTSRLNLRRGEFINVAGIGKNGTRALLFIGIFVMIAGSVWMTSTHLSSAREMQTAAVQPNDTYAFGIDLEGGGVGYYMIDIVDFSNQRIQSEVLDSYGNRIWGRHIDTKTMINYFRFNDTGRYWIKIDNLSDKEAVFKLEAGDASPGRMQAPWIVMLAGLGTTIAAVYMGTVFRISSSRKRKAGRRAGRAR